MNKNITRALASVIIIIGAIFFSPAARAITLVPPSLEFGAQPGESLTTSIKLYNESSDPVTLFTSTSNFTAADEDGTPKFDPQGKQEDLASWISVKPTQYALAPNENVTVPVTITVPKDAAPGGHYAALFFGTQPNAGQGGTVLIASKIGTLIILTVQGQLNESAKVESLVVKSGTRSFTRPPVTIETVINNTGNVHIRPEGTVVIHNMFGGQTASLVFNSSRGAILPNSSRHFDVAWAKSSVDQGRGGFFHEVGAEWHNFALGTYTASLNLTYGSTNQPLVGTVRFTIFPWQLLLVILLVIVAVIYALVIGLRQYNAMIIRRASGSPKK